MKVLMIPGLSNFDKEESGIKRVVEAYTNLLPNYGWQVVDNRDEEYDVVASHAGVRGGIPVVGPFVAHLHGLYWTADYDAANWEWSANAAVIEDVRCATEVTVPSEWVATCVSRGARVSPHVIHHGIVASEWEYSGEHERYVLWNKNRMGDVCDPMDMYLLAARNSNIQFVTTYASGEQLPNLRMIGKVPHSEMKPLVQRAGVYLSTTKETFGIGILEALASGVPVLGYRYGGNELLVQHGVNGFLAEPGDIDGLHAGLEYCVKFRRILSANARETARLWTWERAVEKVAGVYRLAYNNYNRSYSHTVTVVIPCYNYGDKIGRAIASVKAQTLEDFECVIVDDGSSDGSAEQIAKLIEGDNRFRLVRQQNAGVANARNRGVFSGYGKYVCCLDADDAVDPDFLKVCVKALEDDPCLSIAYTGLWYHKPDGSEGLSPWPEQFNYDDALTGKNQIPTCNVARRTVWERLGGQRQRYAPQGAGEEDAEMWLRAGAWGFRAKKVTDAGLFHYSWMSGRVSGNRQHQITDWRGWHPWVRDGKHPFASLATPKRRSHPVHQFDRPAISVIIPLAPHHVTHVIDALDSLEAQTFRDWEAILVCDFSDDEKLDERIPSAYPFLRIIHRGKHGAGHARNEGAKIARAPLLLFLDADDWLMPEALEKMFTAWSAEQAIIYTDYVGKSYLEEDTAAEYKDRLLYYDPKTKRATVAYHSANYVYEHAIVQPAADSQGHVYIWCLVSSLVPAEWHREIGGFDETMISFEDWDYWIRMAKAGKCFIRIPEYLVAYRFYTGRRREDGLHSAPDLLQYLQKKYEGIEDKMCNCKQRSPTVYAAPGAPVSGMRSATARAEEVSSLSDSDFVLILYRSLNKGQHRVIGPSSRRDYGYRSGGDRFLVDRKDVATNPGLFEVLSTAPEQQARTEVPAAPEPIRSSPPPVYDLTDLHGVTQSIASSLNAAGVHTMSDLVEFGEENLRKFKGIGAKRAASIVAEARNVLSMA